MMKEELEHIYNALQGLDIKGTPTNAAILDSVYTALRGLYREVTENAGGTEGPAADPEERDHD